MTERYVSCAASSAPAVKRRWWTSERISKSRTSERKASSMALRRRRISTNGIAIHIKARLQSIREASPGTNPAALRLDLKRNANPMNRKNAPTSFQRDRARPTPRALKRFRFAAAKAPSASARRWPSDSEPSRSNSRQLAQPSRCRSSRASASASPAPWSRISIAISKPSQDSRLISTPILSHWSRCGRKPSRPGRGIPPALGQPGIQLSWYPGDSRASACSVRRRGAKVSIMTASSSVERVPIDPS